MISISFWIWWLSSTGTKTSVTIVHTDLSRAPKPNHSHSIDYSLMFRDFRGISRLMSSTCASSKQFTRGHVYDVAGVAPFSLIHKIFTETAARRYRFPSSRTGPDRFLIDSNWLDARMRDQPSKRYFYMSLNFAQNIFAWIGFHLVRNIFAATNLIEFMIFQIVYAHFPANWAHCSNLRSHS